MISYMVNPWLIGGDESPQCNILEKS